MDELENRLRRALEREDAPEGFAERVIARTRAKSAMRRWMAVAAAVLLLAGIGYGYRWHEGQTAKRQVLLALRITSAKLNHIQAQVAR
jgi:ferric-dicitrate binding protein FerR (iron transport regulator)